MKNDLTCAVVQDLLPSYVEGLTSEEANRAVESHLSACPDCMARKNAMMAPAEPAETAEQSREVDYLKTVKRKSRRRVVLAIACTLAVILAGVALKLFVIGEPASRDGMSWSMRCDETAMDLRVYSTWSGVAYCRWDLENSDGIVRLTATQVLPSLLYDSADHRERISLEGVREVWIADQLIWQDGVAISSGTMDLYAAKTPYVGDISALNRVANALNIQSRCGSYLNSLKTAQEPYGWTLEFSDVYTEKQAAWLDETMEHDLAPLMLALVDNLGEVSWTYRTQDGALQTRTVTLPQISEALPRPVKDYAASPAQLQQLCDLLQG